MTLHYLDEIQDLITDLKKRAMLNIDLEVLGKLTLAEEILPNKGHGFEIIPVTCRTLGESMYKQNQLEAFTNPLNLMLLPPLNIFNPLPSQARDDNIQFGGLPAMEEPTLIIDNFEI